MPVDTLPCPDCGRVVWTRMLARHTVVHIPVTERKCSKCRKVKPIEDFVARAGCAGGREHVCHACHRKRGLEYERRTKWNRRGWMRSYYRRNKAEMDAYQRAWREANPERVIEYRRRVIERRHQPDERRFWNEHSRLYMALRRQSPVDVSARLLAQLVEQAIPRSIPEDVRSEAVGDLFLSVLDHEVSRAQLRRDPATAKRFVSRVYKQFADNFGGPLSLDAPLGPDSDMTFADILEDEYMAA